MLKLWLLRAYARSYGVDGVAKRSKVSPKNVRLAAEGAKAPAGAVKRLEAWLAKGRYAGMSERRYREVLEDRAPKLPFTAEKRKRLRAETKKAAVRTPQFRRIKKWLLKKEVKKYGLEKASERLGVPRTVVAKLLKYSYRKYIPPKESAERIVSWQERLAMSRRAKALAVAKKKKFDEEKRMRRRLAVRRIRYLASGMAYVKVLVPVKADWIEQGDNPRKFDRVSNQAYEAFIRTPEFKSFGSNVLSAYANCTYLAHDRGSDAILELHAAAPEMLAGDRMRLKDAAWSLIDFLSNSVFTFIETHDNYWRVKFVEFTVTMKLSDYGVRV
jgi:hypothetical protein